jgi:plasmid maintenance system antidote protein VapI
MDYMKLVADLCQIIDRQNEITKDMAVQLGQRDALRYEEEMAAVRRDYDTAMGEVDPCKN